tara:strand:- start:1016 stop:2002 length:987 start_codon:yes stop_codon:yes gene_type:complete
MKSKTKLLLKSDYGAALNQLLKPSRRMKYTALDLFAGCGGLATGFEAAGFKTIGMEYDKNCCETYNSNLKGECRNIIITTKTKFPKTDIVIGGPPCQPFSVSGYQKGKSDLRNGIPAFISAIKQTRPKLWMFENVRGILFRNKDYFEKTLKTLKKLDYTVEFKILNCVNFGVPQNRQRVIAVGYKTEFKFPTGSDEKISSGIALGKMAHQIPRDSKFLTPSMDRYVAEYERKSHTRPRDLYLDEPARTLTCRNLAGATADMQRIKLPDGRRRRLRVSEAARLQTFPDWFEFHGTETSKFNQIGNAVPPLMANHLANEFKRVLGRYEKK